MSNGCEAREKTLLRRPGVEPGSTAWKATMLTVTPPTRVLVRASLFSFSLSHSLEISPSTKHIMYRNTVGQKFLFINNNVLA